MKDWAGVLCVATVWSYWIGVGMMIVRVRRKARLSGGLMPEQPLERAMAVVWVPLVAAWLTLPYLSLVREHAPLALPAFARLAWYAALRGLAAAAGFAALLATSLCWSRLGLAWRMAVSAAERQPLITDGPFRHVRHPIYALQVLLVGCSLVVVPTAPMLAIAAVHVVLVHLKARNEERHLERVHGDAYRSYAARTRRFLPWPQPEPR
jgi:protein-S-isoprenylcysteine O-methyltransferase Ste14